MPPRPGSWLGPGLSAALVICIVAVLVYAAEIAPASRSLGAPKLPARSPGKIEFANGSISYSAGRTLYGFNLTAVTDNLSWSQVLFSVTPGPLSGAPTNWTLRVGNETTGKIFPFVRSGWNWTTPTPDPPRLGEALLLSVDSPLVGGSLTATWPSLGPGNWDLPIT